MAQYNQWMNERLYSAVESLPKASLMADKGAFFGSVIGTLNHILVGDLIWLSRFRDHPGKFSALNELTNLPKPKALNSILFTDLAMLEEARQHLDSIIVALASELSDEALNVSLDYQNTKGESHSKRFGFLLQHFFNHQTHHRGQITTLLSQEGIDIGVTDLLAIIPEMDS